MQIRFDSGVYMILVCKYRYVYHKCRILVDYGITTTLIFYYYDYVIVCTIITITMVLYAQLLL
jgi:hypothetical protein